MTDDTANRVSKYPNQMWKTNLVMLIAQCVVFMQVSAKTLLDHVKFPIEVL